MSSGFFNPGAGLGAPASNMPSDPLAELTAKQHLAKLLAGEGRASYADTSPKQHWMQALAQVADGAIHGLSMREKIAAQLEQSKVLAEIGNSYPTSGGASVPPAAQVPTSPGRAATQGVQIQGKLGALDDNNLDIAVRTAMAEAGGMGAPGMRDVAAVLRNRALLSGKTVADEALAKNQFEPWNPGSRNDPRRFKVDSPEYQAALAAVRPILEGSEPDPTGGATHFYAPKAQAALGRKAPSWDDGTGEDRGLHRFFRHSYAGKSPGSLAQTGPADLPAPGAKPVAEEDGAALPRTLEGFAIPPAPGEDQPENLRAQLVAAYDAQQARAAAAQPAGQEQPLTAEDEGQADNLRTQLTQALQQSQQKAIEATSGLGNPTNGTALGARSVAGDPDRARLGQDPRADMPAAGARPILANPMGDQDGTGFVVPPAPDAPPQPGGADPMAGPGGTPDVRAQLAATLAGQQSGPGSQGMLSPSAMGAPAGTMQPPAGPAPRDVPLPPQRPSDAELQAGPRAAPQAVDRMNPATAPGQPATRPVRQRLVDAVTPTGSRQPAATAPMSPTRENLVQQLMGGMQDGLDRIFGGAQTQAALDARGAPSPWGPNDGRGGILNRMFDLDRPIPAQAPGMPQGGSGPAGAPQPTSFSSLPGAGRAPAAVPQGGSPTTQQPLSPRGQQLDAFITQNRDNPQMRPQVEAAQRMVDMERQQSGSQAQPPVQVAQAGGGVSPTPQGAGAPDLNDRYLPWARNVMNMSARGIPVGQWGSVAADILKRAAEPRYERETKDADGNLVQRRPDGKLDILQAGEKAPEGARKLNDALTNWQTYKLPDPNEPANATFWKDFAAQALGGRGNGTTVNNVIGKGEGKQAEVLGGKRGEAAADMEAGARAAPAQIQKLNLLQTLLDKADQGKLGPAQAEAVGWARAVGMSDDTIKRLGLNPGQAITKEAAQKIINELTVGMIGAGGFPANNFSNADREFLSEIFPKIGNQPEANRIAISVMSAVERRKVEAANSWGEYQDRMEAEGKAPDFARWERSYRREVAEKPDLFGDVRKQVEAINGRGGGGTADGLGGTGSTGGGWGSAGGADTGRGLRPGQTTTINGLKIERVN